MIVKSERTTKYHITKPILNSKTLHTKGAKKDKIKLEVCVSLFYSRYGAIWKDLKCVCLYSIPGMVRLEGLEVCVPLLYSRCGAIW